MGSASMMEETTRRRHPSKSVRREVRSGGPLDNTDDEGAVPSPATTSRPYTARKRKKKRRRDGNDEPPFIVLFLQVGIVLLMLSLATYHTYRFLVPAAADRRSPSSRHRTTSNVDDDGGTARGDNLRLQQQQQQQQEAKKLSDLLHRDTTKSPRQHDQELPEQRPEIKRTAPPLPTFELSTSAQWDAFGILSTTAASTATHTGPFWNATQAIKKRFVELYGGENASRMLIDGGTTTFREPTKPGMPPDDVKATACRLLFARQGKRPFRMAFGGYSVTTGRGNRHRDSYPYQLSRLLEPLFQLAGIASIQVFNAAIGGCPSFPYGFCLTQFWGVTGDHDDDAGNNATTRTPDVVSWDFSMNEATGGPEGLEAYVRHLLAAYSSTTESPSKGSSEGTGITIPPPKLIVKDHSTADYRKQVLAEYIGLLHDPVVIHTDRPVQPFLAIDEEFRPPGFQRWRDFGAPKGAPGQALHHPAVQEHKLNGWILAMHFISALEYMMIMAGDEHGPGPEGKDWCHAAFQKKDPTSIDPTTVRSPVYLPPPISGKIVNNTNLRYDSFLFGRPTKEDERTWVMDPIQCRTSFQPKISGDLTEIVVGGTVAEDLEVTLPKSQFYYNRGWTYDLSESEKAAKRKLSLYPEGLGFRDSKEAYYGIFESPKMTLLLPYESAPSKRAAGSVTVPPPSVGDLAIDWYESVILCQVNDKTLDDDNPDACIFDVDVGVTIGGANVTSNNTKMIHTIGSVYLGKPVCKHLRIPPGARLTSHNELLSEDEKATSAMETDQVGLLVEVFVSNPHIVHINQACSVSHVIWQERLKE